MWFKKSLILLFFISAIYAHPLERRANTKPSSSTTSASQTSKSSTKPTSTSSTTKSTSTSSAKLTTSAKLTSSSRITSTSTTLTLKPTSIPASNVTSLQPLFDGNQKIRADNKIAAAKSISQQPSFMFLGCSDNLLNADTIFKAPVGSMISQNTIANQYFGKDANADAAVTYAVENLGVKHIIVLGHYGCKSVEIAIAASEKPANAIEKWVRPITEIFLKSRRAEIKNLRNSRKAHRGQKDQTKVALKADDAGFKAVIEENVKASVRRLQKESYLAKVYEKKGKKDKRDKKDKGKDVEVYVHGLVYNEADGEVKDLRVSFGPFGKKIPTIPFAAVMPPKAQNKAKHLPGFFKGKKQPKKQSGGK